MMRVDWGDPFIQWALADLQREVTSNLQLVRTIRNNHICRLVQRFDRLPPATRYDYMKAVFLQFHGRQADPASTDYLQDYETVIRPTGAEPWFANMREEPAAPLLPRARLRKLMTHVGEATCGKLVFADEGLLRFQEQLEGGAVVESQFDVGGRFHSLSYDHRLISNEYSTGRTSLLSWLGISAQTSWKFVLQDDAESLVVAITKMIALFRAGIPVFGEVIRGRR